jgi:hypothetical protein
METSNTPPQRAEATIRTQSDEVTPKGNSKTIGVIQLISNTISDGDSEYRQTKATIRRKQHSNMSNSTHKEEEPQPHFNKEARHVHDRIPAMYKPQQAARTTHAHVQGTPSHCAR